MIRTVLTVVAMAIGVSAVVAQTDPIATRKGLMKKNNENARNVNRMIRGEAPFDATKVNAAFAQWGETAKQLPNLFPDIRRPARTRARCRKSGKPGAILTRKSPRLEKRWRIIRTRRPRSMS